jgi:V/A-type H+-transporting ATPase subunit E
MSVDNIIAKITADAEDECAQIKAAADKKARAVTAGALREAETAAADIAAQAELDVEEINRRRTLIAELENRKSALAARRQVLDEAFAAAEQKLGALAGEQWETLITRAVLAGCETGGEQLRVPAADLTRYQNGFLTKLNKQLAASGKTGGLTLSDRPAGFTGGVLIVGQNSDYDASFAALLKNIRAECEKEADNILFPAEV